MLLRLSVHSISIATWYSTVRYTTKFFIILHIICDPYRVHFYIWYEEKVEILPPTPTPYGYPVVLAVAFEKTFFFPVNFIFAENKLTIYKWGYIWIYDNISLIFRPIIFLIKV